MTKRGRPSKKTPALCAEIVKRVGNGEPLAQVCRDEHMPHWTTVYDWIEADADFSLAIARARDHGADVIALDALAIADETHRDTVKRDDGSEMANSEWISRSRLRVETRLKLLAKWSPKKYGDKQALEHSGPNGGPIEVNQVQADADDFTRRIAGLTARAATGS